MAEDFSKRLMGRVKVTDLRDHMFMLPQLPIATELRQRFWFTDAALNQGQTPQCVAYSGTAWLTAAPVRNIKYRNPADLYSKCQAIDGLRLPHDGTTVRALFKTLQSLKFVSSYAWAYDVKTMASWILNRGPMVVGTIWTNSMFEPVNGFIRVDGAEVGGHAWMIKGVNLDTKCPDGSKGAFRMINSWGSSWGQNGCASISFKDMQTLLREGGEACTAVEVLKK